MLPEVKRIHLIGIGGSGMNGLAEIFLNLGYKVTGSDMKPSEVIDRLKKMGARIFIGHDGKNIGKAQIVVYSNAVPETNPELMLARKMKLPVIPRAVMLEQVMRLKYGIAIAGAHGKTTTTSMLGQIFEEAKLDPTYIVGGIVKTGGAHARAGKGKHIIVEACEAFGSFLHLNPVIAGVTNIDNDHMDYYKRMDALKAAFRDFINKTPFYGTAYLNGDDENTRSILPDIFVRKVLFGLDKKNDVYADRYRSSGFSQSFRVVRYGKPAGVFTLNVPGRHNVLNALLAISISMDSGIPAKTVAKALRKYKNVRRRFNVFKHPGYTIVDDYAHHPVEVRKVLETGRTVTAKKVIAVFQPHLFSRTQQLYDEFAQALSVADTVILDNIYPAREAPIPGVTSGLIMDAMKSRGYKDVYYEKDWPAIIDRLRKTVKKGDFIFVLGAGSITNIRKEIEKGV